MLGRRRSAIRLSLGRSAARRGAVLSLRSAILRLARRRTVLLLRGRTAVLRRRTSVAALRTAVLGRRCPTVLLRRRRLLLRVRRVGGRLATLLLIRRGRPVADRAAALLRVRRIRRCAAIALRWPLRRTLRHERVPRLARRRLPLAGRRALQQGKQLRGAGTLWHQSRRKALPAKKMQMLCFGMR